MYLANTLEQMKGLSLEEINELFGDPVAVHITGEHDGTGLEKRLENYDVGKHHHNADEVENVAVNGEKGTTIPTEPRV